MQETIGPLLSGDRVAADWLKARTISMSTDRDERCASSGVSYTSRVLYLTDIKGFIILIAVLLFKQLT